MLLAPQEFHIIQPVLAHLSLRRDGCGVYRRHQNTRTTQDGRKTPLANVERCTAGVLDKLIDALTTLHASVDELREHLEQSSAGLVDWSAMGASAAVRGDAVELELHALLAAHPQGTLSRGEDRSVWLRLDSDSGVDAAAGVRRSWRRSIGI